MWLTEHHFSSVPYVPDVMGEYGLSTSPFALACGIQTLLEDGALRRRGREGQHSPPEGQHPAEHRNPKRSVARHLGLRPPTSPT